MSNTRENTNQVNILEEQSKLTSNMYNNKEYESHDNICFK